VQLLGFDLLELDGVDPRLGAFGPAQGCVGQAAASVARRRRDAPYRSGRNGTWLKAKNREHPTMSRDWEDRFS
jgi:hypothetical protein